MMSCILSAAAAAAAATVQQTSTHLYTLVQQYGAAV